MTIKIIHNRISREEVLGFLGKPFDERIKFVVDIKKEIIALGGELHAHAKALLVEEGSSPKDLWGGNLYPGLLKESQIEYSSKINDRPAEGNFDLEVTNEKLRARMKAVVEKRVEL